MKQILNFIIERLRERSTWLGLIGLFTACGLTLLPELQEQIITAGMAAASAIATLTRDKA